MGRVLCRQYCVIRGGSLQMVSETLPSLRWWEHAQAQWGTPARRLGPKGGWLWRPTSPGNEDVLICINAPYMTQRVLKPWWQWTYQNSAVKRAAARAIPGWVTSWEVWYGEPKADNIVSFGVGRYNTEGERENTERERERENGKRERIESLREYIYIYMIYFKLVQVGARDN
jgi:hypothetical protein